MRRLTPTIRHLSILLFVVSILTIVGVVIAKIVRALPAHPVTECNTDLVTEWGWQMAAIIMAVVYFIAYTLAQALGPRR